MTGKERMAAAMARRQPDRVPFMCQLSIGHYLVQLGLEPHRFWLDNETIVEVFCTLADRYQMDGVLINLPGRDPAVMDAVDRVERLPDGSERVWFRDWAAPLLCPAADLPHHEGSPSAPALADIDPAQLFYEDPHTPGGLKYPFHYDLSGDRSPDERLFPPHLTTIIDGVIARVGDRLSVHGEVFSPFTQLMERLSYEHGLMALVMEPDRCHAMLARFAAGAAALARRQAACGVDAVLISSAFAGGGFLSPAMYREFVLPYEATVATAAREAGVVVYTHTCGHIADRLELMAETGIDGIDTMDPAPLGNTTLADAKSRVGDRLFLKGNVDSVNVLLNGSVEDARATARERIADGAADGGYILSTACSVAPRVPAENILALAETAAEAGRYPLTS